MSSLFPQNVMEEIDIKTEEPIDENWTHRFRAVYQQALEHYEQGHRGPEKVIPEDAKAFLASIGTTPQEIYDFVEDRVEVGEPSFETVAAITAVRRDYFLTVQHGEPSGIMIPSTQLPSGHEELGGFRWLPRIIAKARAKLRGEMSPDIMYGCGADRPFLRKVGIDPEQFLQFVWQAGNDNQAILDAVKFYAQDSPTPS